MGGEKIRKQKKRAAVADDPLFFVLSRLVSKNQEQPLKSARATVVTVAGVTTRAALLMSVVVMISDGEQSARPPLFGTTARASTVNGTGAAAGVEYVNPEDENTPTLGLLAGTTSVYCAQFEFAGAPVGQVVFDESEIKPVEEVADVVCVAAMDSSGIVICRMTAGEPNETCCNADMLTSAEAAEVPVVAVTKPCNVAGAVAFTSGCNGMAPRFVPLGTFRTVVALYGRLLGPTATATMSNVPVGSGQNRKLPFESAVVSIMMRSTPVLSGCSMATRTLPLIGAFKTASMT